VARQTICLAMKSERLSVRYLSGSEIDPYVYGIYCQFLRGNSVEDIALSRNQCFLDGLKTEILSGIAYISPMALQAMFTILFHRAQLCIRVT
jgi:hypothetical protein